MTPFAFLTVAIAAGDPGTAAWQRHLVSELTTQVVSVGGTPDAGVVAYGSFWGSIDPGSGRATASPESDSRDLFLVRYDPFGEVLWTRVFATADWDYPDQVVVAPDGDLLITGRSDADKIDLGCGADSVAGGGALAFVARLDGDGSCVWSFAVPYDVDERLPRLFAAGAPEGRTVVGGTFMGELRVGGAALQSWHASEGARNVELFVVALSAGGDATRAAPYGDHPDVDDGNEHRLQTLAGVDVDGYGNVVLAGSFFDQLTLGDTTLDAADGRGFVAKLRPSGALAWARQRDALPAAVAVQPNGVVALGGAVGADLFVAKYDAFGAEKWSRRIGGSASQKAIFALAMDGKGAVSIAAEGWDGTIDLAPTMLTADPGAVMAFVAVLSPTLGATRWARALNVRADRYVEARGLATSSNDRVLLGGWFDTAVDPGDGLLRVSAEGAWDGFLVRYYP